MRYKLTYKGTTTEHHTLGSALSECKNDKTEQWSIWDTIEERTVLTNKE